MSDIILTKTSGDCGDVVPVCTTITIRNFKDVTFDLCTPVGDFPIPESPDTQNIIIKSEGNRLLITVSWTLSQETTTIVGGASSCSIKTPSQQLAYILDTFQPNSISDAFSLAVDSVTRGGYPRKWTFTITDSAPVTYEARMEFIAGDVIAGETQ